MRKYSDQSKGPTNRQLKMGEEIRHALSLILRDPPVFDEVLDKASMTITEVRMSPDLKKARIYVMALGGNSAAEILKIFSKKFVNAKIRHALAKEIYIKTIPSLQFVEDLSLSYSEHIDKILNKVKEN